MHRALFACVSLTLALCAPLAAHAQTGGSGPYSVEELQEASAWYAQQGDRDSARRLWRASQVISDAGATRSASAAPAPLVELTEREIQQLMARYERAQSASSDNGAASDED